MSYELIAKGNVLQMGTIDSFENLIAEGQKGMLEFDLTFPVSQSVASGLQRQLIQHGVEDARVTIGSPLLRVEWRKAAFWIPLIVALVLALLILIVAWRLYREVGPGLSGIVIVGVVALILLALSQNIGGRRSSGRPI